MRHWASMGRAIAALAAAGALALPSTAAAVQDGGVAGSATAGAVQTAPSTGAAAATGTVGARGSARPVTLELRAVPLRSALEEIARQGGVTLLYSADVVPLERLVTVRVRGASVDGALRAVLEGTGVVAKASGTGELMLVRPAGRAPAPAAQRGSLRGHVTDSTSGAPVAGASVALAGTGRVTTTDAAGAYRLAGVAAGAYTLTVRRLGYAPRTVSVRVDAERETVVDVALAPAAGLLDQVVVTGTVVPTARKAVSTPMTVVSDSQIAQQYIRRTDQIFREFVPGSIAWDLGLTAVDQSSVSLRGASSLFVSSTPKIYIDGIEASNATFTVIDPGSIEHVEIVRGPEAATLYGSDAMGGVMQVFTKRGAPGPDRPHIDASVSLGAVQSEFKSGGTLRQDYAFSVHGGSESAGYNLGGSYGRIGAWLPEYFLSNPSIYGGARITNGRLTLDLSARTHEQTIAYTNNPRLVAIGASDSTPRYENATTRDETFGVDARFAATPWWRHELVLGIDHFGLDDRSTRARLTTPADTLLMVYLGDRRKASVRYNTSVRVPLAPAVLATVTAGLDHWELSDNSVVESGATNVDGPIGYDPGNPPLPNRNITTNTGYFGQLQLAVHDALFATVGVRAEHNSNFGAELATPVSPRVGLTYVRAVAGLELKVRGSYGEALRPPLPIQTSMSRSPYYVILGNPGISPERQRGGDIGFDLLSGNRWTLGVTYYRQTAAELIQFVLVDGQSNPPTFQFQNLGRIRNSGLEVEGTLHLSRVDLSAHYAVTNSTVLGLGTGYSGDLQPGDQVLGIPWHTGGLTATIRASERTELSLGATYVGDWVNYDYLALYGGEDRGALRNYWMTYPSFVKANVALTQRLTDSFTGFISVENVANSRAYEADNYNPVQGRITMVGLKASY